MPNDYPRLVIDHFLLQAAYHAYALNMTNGEAVYSDDASPEFRVSTDELVRLALKGRYAVSTMFVEDDGQVTTYSEEAWPVPRDRVLQFSAFLRYLMSPDSDDVEIYGDAINPAQAFGLADAWALRQGLFREDDSSTLT